MRLQKYLADAGVASRRKAEELILSGRVAVNGVIISVLGTQTNPDCDTVTVDGKLIRMVSAPVYLMLHKPEGVVTSVTDPQKRSVVMDYIQDVKIRVYPVGRLDYDTSGLLLLTNDGDLSYKLTHPRYEVKKTYTALLKGVPPEAALQAFRTGLLLDGRRTAPCEITVIKKAKKNEAQCMVSITLHEGRNRQIRKMCDIIGFPVLSLKRESLGPIRLGDLPKGEWRYLTEDEIISLNRLR